MNKQLSRNYEKKCRHCEPQAKQSPYGQKIAASPPKVDPRNDTSQKLMLIVSLFGLYLLLRFFLLLSFPIFNDESMYLRWGYLFFRDPSLWFLSLVIDGKQPAMPVLLGMLLSLPGDPLLITRIFTVLLSAVTFWSVYDLVRNLGKKISPVKALIMISVSPYLLFYDRMVMVETFVVAAHSLALALVIRYLKTGYFWYVPLLSAVTAAGWWFKSTTLFSVASVVSVFLITLRKNNIVSLLRNLFFYLGLFYLLTLPLRLYPAFAVVRERELERALNLGGFLKFPVGLWAGNTADALQYLIGYLTVPVFLFGFFGLLFLFRGQVREKAVAFFLLVPLVLEIMVSRIFTSRYLVMVAPVMAVSAAVFLTAFGGRKLRQGLSLIAIIVPLVASLILIIQPVSYYRLLTVMPRVGSDFSQYIRGWSSGWGVKDAVELIKNDSHGYQAAVFVRADSGNPEDAVIVYLSREPDIKVYYVNEINTLVPTLLTRYPGIKFYFVSRGSQYAGLDPLLEEIGRFDNPFGNGDFVGVYRLEFGTGNRIGTLDLGNRKPV